MILSTDSTANLPIEMYKELDIKMIPLQIYLNGEIYEDLSPKLPVEEFYNKMKEGGVPQTAQINELTAREYFEDLLSKGDDVLHISFSSALSGNTGTIIRVANDINQGRKNKVVVVDTLNASMGEGLLVLLAHEQIKLGKSIDEVTSYVSGMISKVKSYFTVDQLKYLVRGGRLSKISGVVGSLLNIKPILKVDAEGRLVAHKKIIGRKKAINELASITAENANLDHPLYITHAVSIQEAEILANEIEKLVNKRPIICDLTQVIGSHTGPGLLAAFFVQK